MALALCLTLLPAPAWAAEADAQTQTGTSGTVYTVDADTAVQSVENDVVVQAEGSAVADVDGTAYTDLIAAFDAAQEKPSATVKLLADVATNGRTSSTHGDYGNGYYVFDQGNVTFDLNGHTLTWTKYDAYRTSLLVGKNGRLTVCDGGTDGKIYNENAQAINIYAGTLIIQSGTLMSESGKALKIDGGDVSITGGTIHSGDYFGEGVSISPDTVNNRTATLTISGGAELKGGTKGSGLYVDHVGDENPLVKLSGGTYTSGSSGINCSNTTVGTLLDENCRYILSGSEVTDTGVAALGSGVTVEADPNAPVEYIDADGNPAKHTNCTEITAETAKLTDSWYVVKENVTINGDLPVTGSENVDLILCDGATLTISDALTVENDAVLNLYFQSNGTGKLTVGNSTGTVTAPAGEMKKTTGDSSTTFEKCKDHLWTYTNNGENHTTRCDLCGKDGGAVNHSYTGWTDNGDGTHTGTCACGATKTENHTLTCTPNADGLTHSTKCSVCGYAAAAENHNFDQTDEYGKKCECGAYLAAEYNGQQYATLARAIEAAKNGGTVTLQMDVGERITVNDGMNVTIDLKNNGWTTDGNIAHATLVVTGGSVTVQNGELTSGTSSNAYTAVEVEGGKLTVGENMTIQGGSMDADRQFPAIDVKGGELVLSVGATLNGGMKVSVEGKQLKDYLPEGTAFGLRNYDKATGTWTEDKGLFADAYTTNAYNVPDMALVVVEHTQHNFVRNEVGEYVCICGYTCPHNDFKDGKCKICGNGCAHTNVDENGVCRNCKTQMVAKIEVGGTTTYTTDLGTTLYKAADSTKITLLANAAVGTVILKDKTVTLDLNGKTVKNSGRGSAPIQIVSSNSPAKLIITGSGSFISSDQPFVVANGTLDLSGWTGDNSFIYWVTISGASSRFISPTGAGKIDRLAFINSDTEQAADTASLNGGRYDVIVYKRNKRIKLGDLLAEGYAFRQNGTFLEYASKLESNGTVEEVEVVKCPHPDAKDGKCLYCGKDGILARVGDTTYDDVGKAVKGWLANGGTLTLYDNAPTYSNGNDVDFSSGSNNPFIIDLNGFRFNYAGAAITLNGGKSLTIKDSRENESSNGAFGPLVADNGTLTLESGYLQKLTVPSDSLATILLKGGKVSALACPVPVFNLLGNGYCLMSGNITVDPTTILNSGTGTYTIKNPQPLITADKKNGSSSKGERKIPFTLSLKANDSEVGRMQFKWYFIKEDGTTALLAESGDVTATTNDVFTYDATTQSKVAAGWDDTDLKVRDKPYDVICVVTGKDSNGAYLWQTPLRGYKLTIEQTDLKDLKLEFTQVEDTSGFAGPFKGNIKDGKGTFVFEPYGGDVGDASTLTYCFEVYLDGQELEKGKDYIIVDKSNEAKYAGAHTLTIQGMGDYKGTATHTWRIEPYKLTRENYNPPNITKVYDGTTGFDFSKDGNWGSFKENVANRPNDAGTGKNPALGADGNAISIYLKPEDLKASAVTLDSPDVGDRTASYTITLKAREGQSEPNFAFEDGEPPTIQVTAPAYITKASLSPLPEAGKLNVANNHAGVYTLDLAALLPTLDSPKEYGKVTYELDATMLASGYYAVGTATIENGKLILPIKAVETKKTGSIGSVKVKVSTTNYHDFTLTINVNATNKIVPTGEPTLSPKALTYGQALSAIKLSGKLHDNVNNKDVEGTFTWADGTVKPSAGSNEAMWKFTPTDGATYAETTGTVTITVNQAKLTGAPTYTRITAANKTLKDAALKPNTSWPTGTIQWVDKDGKELPDTTEVKANTAYKWIFTPTGADAGNYTTATGELILYSVSTGGSSSGSTVKTDTVTNPDGSVTKTETKSDGTVVETTTGKDGSTTKTETKKDGSSVTENKAADGSTGTVKTDKHGQTTAETTLSSKAIETAKRNGEPVTAPVEVEATRNSDTAPTVKIELPRNSGETKVEIPVTNVKPGTVAVLVHPDGTEEIVKNSLPTEDGIQLTVNGGATVKIVDNSKDFIDTRNHWAKDAIDFVSARGLVNGMNAVSYAPNASTTRAQLWTILARQSDADLSGGANWYEKAQLWSKDKGISDGTNPNGTINRAQMVTMLWRTMGQPAAGSAANFTDVPADAYYAQAVSWAVESGITTGVGGGKFDPNGTCTRGQIATFLYRLYLSR